MTQHQLIKEYCRRNGKIIPAKLREAERAIAGGWIGSECIRRCQELTESGEMYRWPNEGKFAVYSVVPAPAPVLGQNLQPSEVYERPPSPFVKKFLTTQWVKEEKVSNQLTLGI